MLCKGVQQKNGRITLKWMISYYAVSLDFLFKKFAQHVLIRRKKEEKGRKEKKGRKKQ